MTKRLAAALLFLAAEFLKDAAALVRDGSLESMPCTHPEDQRKPLTMGKTGMWECESCGHVEQAGG